MKTLLKKILNRLMHFFRKKELNLADIQSNGESVVLDKTIKNASNPVIVFDIGANVGDYTTRVLELAEKYNRDIEIHLFEPQEYNIRILREKFESYKNVRINGFGLSEKTETRSIFSEEEGSAFGSVYNRAFFKEQGYTIGSETIKLITLEEYLESNQIKAIEFMKIDVEGHELAVINGLGKYLNSEACVIKIIQFEYGGAFLDSGTTLENIYEVLSPKYDIGILLKDGVSFKGFDPVLEDFIYSNYLAILKANNLRELYS
jgi:FkbM family methyltransferase